MYKVEGKIFAFWVLKKDLKLSWEFRTTCEDMKEKNQVWALLDWQHGCWTEEEIHNFCVCSYPGKVMIRIPQNLPHFICTALQFGAAGIMVPQVNTQKEAKEIIESAYVYPLGERSIGGREWFCNKFGQIPWPKYLEEAANNILVLPPV